MTASASSRNACSPAVFRRVLSMTTSAGSSTAGQSVVQGTQRTQVPLGQGRQTAQDGRQLLWYYRLRVQYHGIHLKKRDNESKKNSGKGYKGRAYRIWFLSEW